MKHPVVDSENNIRSVINDAFANKRDCQQFKANRIQTI